SPKTHYYYLLHKAEVACLSRSGIVRDVQVDKVRYAPGETLKGSLVLESAGGRAGGAGTIRLYLEREADRREELKQIPVRLTAAPQAEAFELPLPQEE
ncbi:MAG: hypothetical protein WCI75_18340, partial [candidate division NC10 bacterium]